MKLIDKIKNNPDVSFWYSAIQRYYAEREARKWRENKFG